MAALKPNRPGLSSVVDDEFRIEFDDDVLPPPVSRFSPPQREEAENFEVKLQETQEALLQLRHQARVVERRKEELEEMSRKEKEFTRGRAEVHERLAKALVTIEREANDSRHRLECFLHAKDELGRHLGAVADLHREDWNQVELGHELDRALGIIGDARESVEKALARIGPMLHGAIPAAQKEAASDPIPMVLTPYADFKMWLRRGFAFTLPAIAVGLIASLLHLVF